jgi:acyl-CoA thioesterase FadM
VVTELHISYRQSAGSHDELEVQTEITQLRRASSRWRQRMYRDGELIASQEIAAATTTVGGRPVRFPAELAEALAPFIVDET